VEKIQKKVEELHQLLSKALEEDLPGVLTACYLGIRKELESLEDTLRALVTEHTADVTRAVNESIQADWDNPDKQVDPNSPHTFDEPEAEPEAVEDDVPAEAEEASDEALD
jgi:hypothetical protein